MNVRTPVAIASFLPDALIAECTSPRLCIHLSMTYFRDSTS